MFAMAQLLAKRLKKEKGFDVKLEKNPPIDSYLAWQQAQQKPPV